MAEVPPDTEPMLDLLEPMLDLLGRSPTRERFGGSDLLHSVSGVPTEVARARLDGLENLNSGLADVMGFVAPGDQS